LKEQVGRRIAVTRSGTEDMRRRVLAGSWVGLLLAILGFLVIYPLLTLLLGALTDTNPVVEASVWPSIDRQLPHCAGQPERRRGMVNTLIACGGGT
jgi:iron(III) transport system permease protein